MFATMMMKGNGKPPVELQGSAITADEHQARTQSIRGNVLVASILNSRRAEGKSPIMNAINLFSFASEPSLLCDPVLYHQWRKLHAPDHTFLLVLALTGCGGSQIISNADARTVSKCMATCWKTQ
jgi:hypothetical protein